jgi:hypothetical protein
VAEIMVEHGRITIITQHDARIQFSAGIGAVFTFSDLPALWTLTAKASGKTNRHRATGRPGRQSHLCH